MTQRVILNEDGEPMGTEEQESSYEDGDWD